MRSSIEPAPAVRMSKLGSGSTNCGIDLPGNGVCGLAASAEPDSHFHGR